VYVLPALVLYLIFVILPLLDGVWLSFRQWDGVGPSKYVGFANYRQLASDPSIRAAFVHSLVLVAFYAILPVAIGLFVAASVARQRVSGFGTIRAVLFVPQVIAPVVIGVSWNWLFSYGGPVNAGLRLIGLGSLSNAWLGSFSWALPAVGVIGTWVMFGLCMVLFLSGVQKIPRSLYYAARVDGAGPFREFLAVTLPGLRNEIAIATTLTVIAALRAFDVIFVTTMGGPGQATITPSLLIYTYAFLNGQVGVAAAIAVGLTAVILVIALLLSRIIEGSDRK
jgi:ABC-type sugar transport system permease subunit